MSEWFNMETAPKDGRDILIGWWHRQRWIVVSAHFTFMRDHIDNRQKDWGHWYITKGRGESFSTDHGFGKYYRWMPLPPSPPRWDGE